MKKSLFVNDARTQDFSRWLGCVISGVKSINFQHALGEYEKLDDAYLSYAWPAKKTEINTPSGLRVIQKNSSIEVNENLLNELSCGLKKSLTDGSEADLASWVEAILRWGGVYTLTPGGKGNAGWLKDSKDRGVLRNYLITAFSLLGASEDDDVGIKIPNLRSNAGLTKIYSLGCEDFIIYDSRVAAALTWLLSKWLGSAELVPDHLRFAPMRANTSKKAGKLRTANEDVFHYFAPSGSQANHVKHLMWNIRANWLLEDALIQSNGGQTGGISSMRALEAALFVLGDDLSFAKRY